MLNVDFEETRFAKMLWLGVGPGKDGYFIYAWDRRLLLSPVACYGHGILAEVIAGPVSCRYIYSASFLGKISC